MTEERDPKVSKRYRGLGREEPPRDVDERILAASRRATSAGRHRWAASLAAAAVLVLAVGVALHVERNQPKEDVVARAEPAKPAPPAAPVPAFTPDPKPQEPSREMRARPQSRAAPAPAPAPQAAPAPRMEDARRERSPDELARTEAAASEARANSEIAARRDAQKPAAQAGARPELAKAQQSPEQWLERIAQLRREGKQEEADRQLAEFGRAYPDYRYSDEMKAKVERTAPVPAR